MQREIECDAGRDVSTHKLQQSLLCVVGRIFGMVKEAFNQCAANAEASIAFVADTSTSLMTKHILCSRHVFHHLVRDKELVDRVRLGIRFQDSPEVGAPQLVDALKHRRFAKFSRRSPKNIKNRLVFFCFLFLFL